MNEQSESTFKSILPREYIFNIENTTFNLITYTSPVRNKKLEVMSQNHFHPHYELYYLDKGAIDITIENTTHHVLPGDVFCIPPKISHVTDLKSDTEIYVLDFTVKKNSLKTSRDLYSDVINLLTAPYLHLHFCEAIADTIIPVAELALKRIPIPIYKITWQFFLIIETLYEISGTQSKILMDTSMPDNSMNRLCVINRLIHEYYNKDLKLKDVADAIFLSEKQANRIISKYYGCTFHALITQFRLKKATELLKSGNASMSKISSMVGYTSVNTFYSAFTKAYGCLPTQYREKMQKKA